MLFNSLEFGLFLCGCLIVFVLLPGGRLGRHPRNAFLLLASYGFYAAWDWRFLGLLWLSTLVDFSIALRMAATTRPRSRRWLVAASLFVNLSILGFFKYAGFFSESLAELLAMAGLEAPRLVLHVILPVGISFYTFQTLSYTIDVYRGRLEPTRNLLDFALFVAFFPQLVAGPIERAAHMLPQIASPQRVQTISRLSSAGWLILWGLFKKAVIADNLAPLVDAVYAPEATPSGPEIWLATHAFMIQIYCDFSGYTDIARGVALLFGFELMENFRLPFLARSPADYWRRWHISLSSWLRDYLYVSLGGNRRGSGRTYANLFLTMLLGGLWHGAAWSFVIWGGYQGAILIAHRWLAQRVEGWRSGSPWLQRAGRFAGWLVTFELMAFGWLLFRAESVGQIERFVTTLFSSPDWGRTGSWLPVLLALFAPLLVVQIIQARSGQMELLRGRPVVIRTLVYLGVAVGLILLGEDGGEPFIYFQF